MIAASRPENKNISTGAAIRAKPGTALRAFINYWRPRTIKPVVTSLALVRNPILPGRVYERTQTESTFIHSSVTSKVRDVDLLKFSTVHKPVDTWFSVSQKSRVCIFFYSFFPVCFVAKRYILQQKCLNGQIGVCLLGTRWYNF